MESAYNKAIALSGQSDLAIQAAMASLAGQGFLVTSRQDRSVEFKGPGLKSTRQPPIFGASRIQVRADRGQLTLEAELGGVERMRRFLISFPLAMAIGSAIFFSGVLGWIMGRATGVGFGVPFAPGWSWVAIATLFSILPLTPWVVISPALIRSIHRRTIQALDDCLSNINTMSQG